MLKEYQGSLTDFSQKLDLQWPIQVVTEEQFQNCEPADRKHFLIVDSEDEEISDPDLAVVLAKGYLAEQYDPILVGPQLSKEWDHHPRLDDLRSMLAMTQKASDIWALDVINERIGGHLVPEIIQKHIPAPDFRNAKRDFMRTYSAHVVAQGAYLEGAIRRYGFADMVGQVSGISQRIGEVIPDFLEPYYNLVESYRVLPAPLQTRDEMLDVFEESSRYTARQLKMNFSPSLKEISGSAFWTMGSPKSL